MDRFIISGGKALDGTVEISGAKNAALPLLAASLLTSEPVILHNLPDLHDVDSMFTLLDHLGAEINSLKDGVEIRTGKLASLEAPYNLVRKMRASILVLGPLLARAGRSRVSLPGGCAIGTRPVDLHIDAMRHLGANITLDGGYIMADSNGRLSGGDIFFEKVTVTGTENVLMASVLARGTTVLRNCAVEPEVEDLARLLISMGANIDGLGTSTITIEGVESLHGAEHIIIPDRIEAGTFLFAALITKGTVKVSRCNTEHLRSVIDKLLACGGKLEISENQIVTRPSELLALDVSTAPHPGFPTDMQAQYMALMTQAEGTSVIHETIFENRFMHVPELKRMGANIRLESGSAVIVGANRLKGADVMATDLRASASLVLAGLVAEGETTVNRVYHIDRGYSHIVGKLRALGAEIERVPA